MSDFAAVVEKPMDLAHLCLGERIYVKLKGNRTIRGTLHVRRLPFYLYWALSLTIFSFLQAFDQHMNLILGDAEETVTYVVTENDEEVKKSDSRNMEILYVRGDMIILFAPPVRA